MKKQKWLLRILSVGLAVLFTFYAVPSSASSQAVTATEPAMPVSATVAEDKVNIKGDVAVATEILEEDTSRRGEYEKHFPLNEGSILAVSYTERVHKETAPGVFEEIDNTLSLKGERLENADDDFKVSFAEKSSDELVKIASGGYNMQWGLSSFTMKAF